MPNWCSNTLEISHEDKKMMKRVVKGYNKNGLLKEFIPVPKELFDTVAGNVGSPDSYEQKLLSYREKLNMEHFGYKNWYDFCVGEWGTKWDIGHGDAYDKLSISDIKNNTLTIGFDSAWSPPVDAYVKLCDMGFQITAMYYEGGCCFCGIWENGRDECYEIKGNSNWVKRNIPSEIDEEFAISMNMADWEAEQEEENAETEES
jgi:hypothetical protein